MLPGTRENGKEKMGNSKRRIPRALAFVAGGALPGIKPVGSDAEHVVALDADAVDDRTNDGAGLRRFGRAARGRSGRLSRNALSGHEGILARCSMASKKAGGIHGM